MSKKKPNLTLFLILGGLVIVALIVGYFLLFNEDKREEDCFDLNNELNFQIAACYDAYTGKIYVEMVKSNDGYFVKGFEFSFFDFEDKSFKISEDFWSGSSYLYKFPADRNPAVGYFNFGVSGAVSNKCNTLKSVPIGYCPASVSLENLESPLTLISESIVKDFVEVTKETKVDFVSSDLVDRDSVWSSVCESKWDCGAWEDCFEGLRKRECVDLNNCTIPTNIPTRVNFCGDYCVEDWRCEWSECINGISNPSCVDLNNCGTERDKPSAISCSKKCTPNIYCEDWSLCNVNYNLIDVRDKDYFYEGVRTRLCSDKNNCVSPYVESKECSLQVDVYTKVFKKCGKDYIGVYETLTGNILAAMQKGPSGNDYLNIDLTKGSEGIYCDYCFDGILNGDEEKIDCGGSCPPCEDYKVYNDYQLNFLEKIFRWFKT